METLKKEVTQKNLFKKLDSGKNNKAIFQEGHLGFDFFNFL